MTRLTPTESAVLRQKPQNTHLYLSIFQPVAIFKAQVNDASITKGARTITYDTVSLGTFGLIQDGMTMWVGTSLGINDVGKIRVRSATSTEIIVSENNNIVWQDNLYLTVFNYWELWPVYPHIISDPNNAENVIFYKDYDIAYTNQNSILGTFANAGPHRATFLDPASGQAQIYYSATGSYNMLGDSLNYNWFFEGATVTGSSLATPGYITYNTPGYYVTRLSISGSSGEIDTTYRYISVYDDAHPPIQKWQLQSLQGSRDEGGYTASIKVFEIIPIQEHAVVVLFGNSYYGDTQQNIGGNFPNSGDIFYVGYIDKDSIQYNYEHSEVSFDAVSLTSIMKKSSGFSVSVQSVLSPTKWYELLDMDSHRALYHYLRWHTTALNIADFQFVGDDPKIQFFDSDRGSMFDAIDNYMKNTLIGHTVSDRQGKIWMEVDAMAYPNPTGTFTPYMNITKNDWMNTPTIDERLTADVAFMEYGGIQYSGVNTGTFAAYMAMAPGNAPGFYGGLDDHQGLALGGQDQLNQMLGNIFANKNSPYPSINMEMSLNASNLDIAPQETTEVHITPADTVRNIYLDGLYIPDSITWKYNPKDFMLFPQIDFKQLINGTASQTEIIPAVSDVGGGFEYNPYSDEFPELPIDFPSTSNDIGDGAPPRVLVHDPVAGMLYTQTFNTPSPQWYQVNGGLTLAQYQSINKVVVCPNGAVYVGSINNFTTGFLARAPFAGAPFEIIVDVPTVGYGVLAFNCNREVGESVLYMLGRNGDECKAYLGFGNTFTAKASFTQFTNGGSSVSYGLGAWVFTSNSSLKNLGPSANSVVSSVVIPTTNGNQHIRATLSGRITIWGGADVTLSSNNGATFDGPFAEPSMTSNGYTKVDIIGTDASGVYLMAGGGSSQVPYKSSDGGYSWSALGTLSVPQDDWRPCNAGSSSKWILVSTYVYYTDDFGNTTNWKDKRGNLLTISPFLILNSVNVIP